MTFGVTPVPFISYCFFAVFDMLSRYFFSLLMPLRCLITLPMLIFIADCHYALITPLSLRYFLFIFVYY